jgi:hypothetical protein
MNSGAAEHGPFFEHQWDYVDPRDPNLGAYGEGTTLRLTQSAAWIREMCSKPGSPFRLMDAEQAAAVDALRLERDQLAADVERLSIKLESKEAELAEARALERVVDKALADGVLARLDARYAKKPGPKPGPKAA